MAGFSPWCFLPFEERLPNHLLNRSASHFAGFISLFAKSQAAPQFPLREKNRSTFAEGKQGEQIGGKKGTYRENTMIITDP
jgi:hypothetical protein